MSAQHKGLFSMMVGYLGEHLVDQPLQVVKIGRLADIMMSTIFVKQIGNLRLIGGGEYDYVKVG